jgi:hypothetical protein
MDDLSRLGLSAMAMALTDAGQIEWPQKRAVGILAGTVYSPWFCGCTSEPHGPSSGIRKRKV